MSSLIVEVCKVNKVEKHPNADRVSIAEVKGWNCIIGLDQYKEGDLVVFVPPDSIIPNNLVEKYNLEYLRNGGRVGTAKLRGYLSQGLILDVPEGKFKVGDDVANVLGIKKYEPPIASFQKSIGNPTSKKRNPSFNKYTDIENIKNYKDIFKSNDLVVVTEKIHGSNWRAGNVPRCQKGFWNKIKSFLFGNYEFVYGSHNVQISNGKFNGKGYYGTDIYGKISQKYNMKEIILNDYIVYGEVYGKGIQDLTYGLNDIDLVVFDVNYKGKYLPWADVKLFCKARNLPLVPEIIIAKWEDVILENCTNGTSFLCHNQIREGCVVKSLSEENHPMIGRKILKSISPDYLLRKNGTEFK